MPSETPDLGEIIAELMAATLGRIETTIPARVVSYDSATQTVTAKPSVSGRYQDSETGELVPYALPTVANVPVWFPAGAGGSLTFPLAPDDDVLLICASRSLDEWKSSGAAECVPQDTRRHDLTDAIALPGLRPFARVLNAAAVSPTALVLAGADIRLGSSAASSAVVLETLLSAFLAQLKTWLDSHVHTGVVTGPGSSGPPAAPSPAAGGLGAAKVRAE